MAKCANLTVKLCILFRYINKAILLFFWLKYVPNGPLSTSLNRPSVYFKKTTYANG